MKTKLLFLVLIAVGCSPKKGTISGVIRSATDNKLEFSPCDIELKNGQVLNAPNCTMVNFCQNFKHLIGQPLKLEYWNDGNKNFCEMK